MPPCPPAPPGGSGPPASQLAVGSSRPPATSSLPPLPQVLQTKNPMKLQIQPGHENFDKMHSKRNDTILLSGCFYQYFSASGAGQGSIDNRIEQAMDLVKSHLMSAVRSEVEELREKIAKLEDTVQVLSRENDTLRNHVAPEVLNQLPNPAQRGLLGPQHLNSLPPPEPAHPALQPPQH